MERSSVLMVLAGLLFVSVSYRDHSGAMAAGSKECGPALAWSVPTEVYNPTGRFYTYAPTVLSTGGVDRIWSCHNREDGFIRDHIYYTEVATGRVVRFSKPVLFPGPEGAWDSVNVCDPSILEGSFTYEGSTYRYALFYTGNDIFAINHCQVGVAFSTDLTDGGK
jgi:hypothetical protein